MDVKSSEIDYNQVVFRLAEPRDHVEVNAMCKGALGGRDTLPAMYLHYLKDPSRKLYVAVYKGRVVALSGGRIIDDGNTVEGNLGRALPGTPDFYRQKQPITITEDIQYAIRKYLQKYAGTFIKYLGEAEVFIMRHLENVAQEMRPGVFQELRAYSMRKWIMEEHPHIKTFRGVVRNEKAAFQSPNISAVPVIREIVDLAWKVPAMTLTKAVDVYHRKFQEDIGDLFKVQQIHRDGVAKIFNDGKFRQRYIPSGILLVDASPLDLDYQSNIDIIVSDESPPNMYMSFDEEHQIQAASFGTAIEMDVIMETLRYNIDYYGISNLDHLIVHTMKHISLIPALLEQSQTAKDAYVAIFVQEGSFCQNLVRQVLQFMTEQLSISNRHVEFPLERQFVMEMKLPLKTRGDLARL